jgi:hypothetical protein
MRKFIRHTLPIFILLIKINIASAQKDGYFNISSDFGIPISQYQDNKNTLTNRFFNNHTALSFSGQYRLWNRIGFEGGVGQHFEYLAFRDEKFASRNNGFLSDITSKNAYLNAFGAIQFFQPINTTLRMYLTGGYSLNWLKGATKAGKTSEYVAGQESLSMQNSFFNNTAVYGEIGFEGTLGNDNVLSIGLKYNIGQSAMMKGNYSVSKNGTPIEQDQITSMGTYIGLTLKYGINFFHQDKAVIKPKAESNNVNNKPPKVTTPPQAPQKTKEAKQPKEKTTIKIKPPKTPTIPTSVDGRTVSVTKKITVKNSEVVIKVWDHQMIDGDIISLNLNGKWILQKYTLEKEHKEIHVKLQAGTNYLVLHAHNLGIYSPNTAAVSIFDGKKEQTIVLESTLNASGTIQIDLK